jgi:tetratricopeptide (TPR) repeat protein
LDPKNLHVRRNLGAVLLKGNFNAQAVIEFRELEALAPDSEICHLCLGGALYGSSDFKGAEKEYGIAAKLDPSDSQPHIRLGDLHEFQKNYAAALQEYSLALQLDENSAEAHRGAGRVLLAKKDYANAVPELKQAANLEPSVAISHDLYAQALQATGKTDAAIAEFKQSLSLDAKQPEVRLKLAAVLEKKGDWVGSLDQYRRAALAGSTVPLGNGIFRVISPNPRLQYKDAQERFSQHLASLKAAGKSAEAAKLEAGVATTKAGTGITEKIDAAMQAGSNALMQRQWDEAIRNYKHAVELGDKLQPHDGRLAIALGELGRITMGLQNFTEADTLFHRQLKVSEEVYGAQSPMLGEPLQNLGMMAAYQRDSASAKNYLNHALELNEKTYGENSPGVATSLRMMATPYFIENDFAKAEPLMLRAVKIDQTLYGPDGAEALPNLTVLCSIYDKLAKPEKAAPCQGHLLAILEKQYGTDNPILVPTLTSQATALRSLGRNEEAAKLEQRIKTIQATAMNQN